MARMQVTTATRRGEEATARPSMGQTEASEAVHVEQVQPALDALNRMNPSSIEQVGFPRHIHDRHRLHRSAAAAKESVTVDRGTARCRYLSSAVRQNDHSGKPGSNNWSVTVER